MQIIIIQKLDTYDRMIEIYDDRELNYLQITLLQTASERLLHPLQLHFLQNTVANLLEMNKARIITSNFEKHVIRTEGRTLTAPSCYPIFLSRDSNNQANVRMRSSYAPELKRVFIHNTEHLGFREEKTTQTTKSNFINYINRKPLIPCNDSSQKNWKLKNNHPKPKQQNRIINQPR